MDTLRDDSSSPVESGQHRTVSPNEIPSVSDGKGGPSGIRIGRFTLGRQLGAGGMGAVFEARQDEPNRLVALKLMNGSITSESARTRFRSESEHLARLNHPHVAQVYEAGTHDRGVLSIPYFAMELVPGARTVTQFSREIGAPVAERLKLVAAAAEAVQHAHERGITHRDLKPGNVLVDESGLVKVIDFGLARLIDDDAEGGGRTITLASDASLMFGTPPYMSPEHFDQNGTSAVVDHKRSDVYSLGVILYELLCGQLPFVAPKARDPGSTLSFAKIVLETEPARPRTLNAKVTRDVETIVLKCLSKDPERRYLSAGALAADLRRVVADEPIEARRESAGYRISSHARVRGRRNPAAVLVLVTLLCLVGAEKVGWLADDAGLRWAFERTAMRSAVTRHFDPNASLNRVRLITINANADWRHLAELVGVLPNGPTDAKALRGVHGVLMRRLADEKIELRVLAFDIFLPGRNAHDADFAKGAVALAERSIGVVVGTAEWDTTSSKDTDASISGAIAPYVITGGLTAWLSDVEPWSLHALWKRGSGVPRPSLALAAAARVWHPQLGITPSYELTAGAVEVHGMPGMDRRAPITHIYREPVRPKPSAVEPGDTIASYYLEMPSTKVLDDATVSYEAVLRATPQQLHEWFDNRAVIVGDLRPGADSSAKYLDGRTLRGMHAMTVGIERLLSDAPIRQYPSVSVGGIRMDGRIAIDLLVAVCGAFVGYRLSERVARRLVVHLLTLCTLAVWSFCAYRAFAILNSPTIQCFAFVLAAEGVAAARKLVRPLFAQS